MRRLANGTQAASLPAPAAITGTPGYGIAGNPGLGVLGSIFDADIYNTFQEELFAFLTAAGVSPDNTGADLAQVLKSAKRLFGANVTTLTANTTLTADHAGLLLLSASGGTRTFTLPLAASAGGAPMRLAIVRTDTTTANTLNLIAQGSDTLNGLTGNCALPVGATVVIMSDGVSAWRLVSSAGLFQKQTFTASTTVTVPWWSRRLEYRLWGGGGGGGGANGTNVAACGGGGGEYREGVAAVVPGASLTATVGAAGAAGTTLGGNGGSGGTTSLGSIASANGGSGAFGSTSGIPTPAGPGGSGGSGGDFSANGQSGTTGNSIGGTYGGGVGGGSFGFGITVPNIGSGNGQPGAYPGQGGCGGGGTGVFPGGAGGTGLIVAEFKP